VLDKPAITDSTWEMVIRVPKSTIQKIEKVVAGRWVVLYLPQVLSKKLSHTFGRGPIRRMRIKPVQSGTVIMLMPRSMRADRALTHIEIAGRGPAAIRLNSVPETTTVLDHPSVIDQEVAA
jgi:hypothetical protein